VVAQRGVGTANGDFRFSRLEVRVASPPVPRLRLGHRAAKLAAARTTRVPPRQPTQRTRPLECGGPAVARQSEYGFRLPPRGANPNPNPTLGATPGATRGLRRGNATAIASATLVATRGDTL
jgi:hypothetical protein